MSSCSAALKGTPAGAEMDVEGRLIAVDLVHEEAVGIVDEPGRVEDEIALLGAHDIGERTQQGGHHVPGAWSCSEGGMQDGRL